MSKSNGLVAHTPENFDWFYHHAMQGLLIEKGESTAPNITMISDRYPHTEQPSDMLYLHQAQQPEQFARFEGLIASWDFEQPGAMMGWKRRPAETLATLADLRAQWDAKAQRSNSLNTELKARQAEFNEENQPLIDEFQAVAGETKTVEALLRAAAERYFIAHPDEKDLIAGVSIQERQRVTYDETAMLKWAIANAPYLVKLDADYVERYVLGLVEHSTVKRDLLAHIQTIAGLPAAVEKVPTAALSKTKGASAAE